MFALAIVGNIAYCKKTLLYVETSLKVINMSHYMYLFTCNILKPS